MILRRRLPRRMAASCLAAAAAVVLPVHASAADDGNAAATPSQRRTDRLPHVRLSARFAEHFFESPLGPTSALNSVIASTSAGKGEDPSSRDSTMSSHHRSGSSYPAAWASARSGSAASLRRRRRTTAGVLVDILRMITDVAVRAAVLMVVESRLRCYRLRRQRDGGR